MLACQQRYVGHVDRIRAYKRRVWAGFEYDLRVNSRVALQLKWSIRPILYCHLSRYR